MHKSHNAPLTRAVRATRRAGVFGSVGGVALCAALLGGPAVAQTTGESDAPLEEVTVTGIRQSLSNSAELKRESAIVQDSISQEDLGKFPDANIAESLQRIPGVSIDRSNGEGKSVTVRGLGPQFNSVLFNGRALASDDFGREFSSITSTSRQLGSTIRSEATTSTALASMQASA